MEGLTWHQPHCSTLWPQYLQKALLLSLWDGGGEEREKQRIAEQDRMRQGGRGKELLAYTNKPMDKMSLCVRAQNILTGQRQGNESLPLKCCHAASLQERGWNVSSTQNNSNYISQGGFCTI